MRRYSSFTLIELLIVVAIIAVLAVLASVNYLEARTRSRVAAVKSDLRQMAFACEAYRVDANSYAPAENAFLNPASQTQTWRMTTPVPYITQIVLDPFYKVLSFAGLGGPFGPGGKWMHYISDRGVTESWLLWSYGPDQDMEFAAIDYDPTNGTTSDGDIYRVGELP